MWDQLSHARVLKLEKLVSMHIYIYIYIYICIISNSHGHTLLNEKLVPHSQGHISILKYLIKSVRFRSILRN